MSDSEIIGGGIVGGLIGYGAGRKKGFSEGYQQAILEKEREITALHNEILRLREQIKQNPQRRVSSDILKQKLTRKLDMKKVRELLDVKKKLHSKS